MVYLNEWRLNSRAILKFQRFQSKIIKKARQKYDIFDKKNLIRKVQYLKGNSSAYYQVKLIIESL